MIERDPLSLSEPDYTIGRRHTDMVVGRALLQRRIERELEELDDAIVGVDHEQLAALRAGIQNGAASPTDSRAEDKRESQSERSRGES